MLFKPITKLKGIRDGKEIELGRGDEVYIPSKLIKNITNVMEVQDDVLNSFTNKYLEGEELRIFNRIKQLVELYGEGRTGNQNLVVVMILTLYKF